MIKDIETYVDKIYLTRKDIKKIDKYFAENSYDTSEFDKKLFFPLDRFILEVEGSNIKGLVELKNYSPCHFVYTSDTEELHCDRQGPGFQSEYNCGNTDKEYTRKKGSNLQHILLKIMFYIIVTAEQRKRELRISPTKERKQSPNYEYKQRELFFITDIIEYVRLHPTKKSVKYRCEVWGVRGHIRHTQHGIQFVHPYKKGRKRNELEPASKTYLLEKD